MKPYELLDDSPASYTRGQWVESSFVKAGLPVYRYDRLGNGDFDKVHDFILGYTKEVFSASPSDKVFSYWAGYNYISLYPSDGKVKCHLYCTDKDLYAELKEGLEELISELPKKGSFCILVKEDKGYKISQVGETTLPFVKENYASTALDKIDHMLSCSKSETPCGRLVILDGPPGTGKSYLIRGIANEVSATFILVSSSLVGSLSGPDLLPVLLSARQDSKRPVVLVLEDADHALVNRDRGKLIQISELLNIGDGILGELVDLRIIATTNAGRSDLDRAITRPGRLCSYISLDKLPWDEANNVYKRLTSGEGEPLPRGQEFTLAEIYRKARLDGWEISKEVSNGRNYL